MTELQHLSGTPELYERLINRMELALETASTAVRLRNELLVELEFNGLTNAEFELIEAYLEKGSKAANGAVKDKDEDGFKAAPESSGALPASRDPVKVIWLKDKRRAGSASRSSGHSKTTFRF
ncbi:hypothetical protein PS3A_15450 [Pseudomonas sp. 3A(2025)]